MSTLALFFVFSSALLHSLWNLLAKQSSDKVAFMWWIQIPPLFLFLPLYIFSGEEYSLSSGAIWFILISAAAHTAYRICIGVSYEKGDMSVVYPIARSAPAFVVVWSILFLSERLTVLGFGGIVLVVFGCYVVALEDFSLRSLGAPLAALFKDVSYQIALLTAVLISIYYVVDKMALAYMPPMAFRYISQIPSLLFFSVFAIPFKRNAILSEWTLNRKAIVAAGTVQFASYLLLLYGMNIASASYAAAVRQLSIPIGVLIGTFILKEAHGLIRFVGSMLILAGVLVISIMG
jgi:drug/metabolite transporter (DMT)-like permease